MLGHGLAVEAIRAHAKPGVKIGSWDNLTPVDASIETPEQIAAAKTAIREENVMFGTVIREGKYTDAYPEEAWSGCADVYGRRYKEQLGARLTLPG